jgi:hypothetical protein
MTKVNESENRIRCQANQSSLTGSAPSYNQTSKKIQTIKKTHNTVTAKNNSGRVKCELIHLTFTKMNRIYPGGSFDPYNKLPQNRGRQKNNETVCVAVSAIKN